MEKRKRPSEDEIAGTGYCGSPRGAKNCIDEGVCFREKLDVPSGERYELCKSVHAEENIIVSARRRDMKGGTLYIYGEDCVGKDPHFRVEPCILCKRKIILENESFMLYGKEEEESKDA